MKDIIMYTDGACSNNPGPGGWGCIIVNNEKIKELSGYCEATTNNRMELTAVVEGLKSLNGKCNVMLYSDSAYVVNAFLQDWISNWIKRNWKNADKKPVANKDLWLELIALANYHNITWNKVKGHSNVELNNRCDKLATDIIAKNRPAEDSE